MRAIRVLCLALPLLLASCGSDGEDFMVEVKRPVAAVVAPFVATDLAEAQALFSGLTIKRTRPSDNEIVYTIPGDGAESIIRLRFEPLRGGEATTIHATVDVPPVRAKIDGVDKVLSEYKIERRLKSLIEAARSDLEMGSSGGLGSQRLSILLVGVAVATNKKYLDQALAFKDDPERVMDLLGGFGTAEEYARDVGDRPQDNPELAGVQDEVAQARSEYRNEQAMAEAARPADDSAPMDDAGGGD